MSQNHDWLCIIAFVWVTQVWIAPGHEVSPKKDRTQRVKIVGGVVLSEVNTACIGHSLQVPLSGNITV